MDTPRLTPEAAARIRANADASANEPWTADGQRHVVRRLRNGLNLTQAELAQKVQINDSKLSLFENGLIELSDDEWKRVSRFLFSHKGPWKPGQLDMLAGTYEARQAQWQKHLDSRKHTNRRFLRKQAGMSQRELALATGIPRNKIIEWEAGRLELTAKEQAKWQEVIQAAESRRKHSDPWWKLKVAHYAIEDLLEDRKRWLPRLQNLTSVDDPVIAEIIASFRREISELEAAIHLKKVESADD
jgi:transcriptional regulator with XRE-family HTH domain